MSLAHQKPPNPEANMVKLLAEEDSGIVLHTELRTINALRPMDTKNSGDLAFALRAGMNAHALTRATAQTRPEKTFARSPGIITM